ncbi:MAG: oligopeptidase B, partial [Nocardioides sp.]
MTHPEPPVAERRPHTTEHHGRTRVDDYEWLRAKESPEVVAHLADENAYTEVRTAHLAGLRQSIFDEIKARTRETDLSVPTRNRDHWYYARSFEGREYGASCRVPVTGPDDWTPPSPAEDCSADEPALPGEQVLLDLNELAEGHDFFSLGGSSISPDASLLAYSTDVVGDERFTVRIKDLATGELLPDQITGVLGGVTWDREGAHVYYTTVDESWRADKIWRHALGTDQEADELVHHEPDGRFWVGLGRTRSDRFLVIAAGSKTTSEYRVLDADAPELGFRVFSERREGVEY